MTKQDIKRIKKNFIQFIKDEILYHYDGFNWYQKMNLLCDEITYNDAINIIYHKVISSKNYINLYESVKKSSYSKRMKNEEFDKLYNVLTNYMK